MKKPIVTLTSLVLTALLAVACSDLGAAKPAVVTTASEVPAPSTVVAAAVQPGEKLYNDNCAQCHDKSFYKAPSRMFISALSPQNLLKVMTTGRMNGQAAHLADEQRTAIAEFLSGKKITDQVARVLPASCDAQHSFDPTLVPVSIGWGVDLHNTRFQPLAAGGLSADNVERLEVKWTFAYPGAYQARSEPVYGGGAVYVGSQDGTVWALDAVTGCLRWSFQAVTEVRTGIAISQWQADDKDVDPTLYFGDTMANVYALSAKTGELRWKVKADDHPYATMTGTPTVTDGVVYVPVSSLEVIAPANPSYECCSFRGALLALNGATGAQIWKSYTIDEAPKPVGKNAAGTVILAPSGAPIWSSPTVVTELRNVPGSYSDLSPAISSDGLTLFFASTRPGGGGGGLDYWVTTRKDRNSKFGPPVPVTEINTSQPEQLGQQSADGFSFYYSLDGVYRADRILPICSRGCSN